MIISAITIMFLHSFIVIIVVIIIIIKDYYFIILIILIRIQIDYYFSLINYS